MSFNQPLLILRLNLHLDEKRCFSSHDAQHKARKLFILEFLSLARVSFQHYTTKINVLLTFPGMYQVAVISAYL